MDRKKITNFVSQAKQFSKSLKLQKNQTAEKPEVDFEQVDKELIKKDSHKRFPSWRQIKHINKYLSPLEKKVLQIAGLAIIISIFVLLGNFYWQHSELVPEKGGEYTEGLVGTPNYINPLLAQYNDVDRDLSRLIFNGLLKYDQQGQLSLDLASELNINPNQTEYTFTLRDDVIWHDGESFTANDVIYTIASIQDTKWQSPYRLAFANVTVEKINDYQVKFILTEPLANFLHSLTVGIIPEHLWITVPTSNVILAELNKKPIGTGPYQFSSLTKDKNGNIRTMILTRNEDYFDQVPYIEDLTFKFYGDYQTGAQALANDNVEGLNLLPKEYQTEVIDKSNVNFLNLSLPQYTAIFFNTNKNDLLKDKALRQALAYAVDREKILQQSLNSQGKIINSPILPGYTGYTEEVAQYNYSPAKANELLDKTGWLPTEDSSFRQKNDSTLTFTLTTVENPEYEQAVNIIKENWEAIGVKTEIKIVSKDQIKTQIIEPRDYEALVFGQIIRSDPFPFWHSSQISNPGINLTVWAHKGVDDLLERARTTTNNQDRAKMLIDFQKILTENAAAIFLYNPVHLYPVADKIKGIQLQNIITPADRFNNISHWYIETERKFSW